MERPSAKDVFRGYLPRAMRLFGLGLAITLVGAVIASTLGGDGRHSDVLVGLPVGFGTVILFTALLLLPNLIRMKARVRHSGFRPFRMDYARVSSGGNGQPMIRLSCENESFILTVVAFVWRWRGVEEANGSEVWFAGDGKRGGVLVLPNALNRPFWLRRIKFPPFRRSMERRAFGMGRSK